MLHPDEEPKISPPASELAPQQARSDSIKELREVDAVLGVGEKIARARPEKALSRDWVPHPEDIYLAEVVLGKS